MVNVVFFNFICTLMTNALWLGIFVPIKIQKNQRKCRKEHFALHTMTTPVHISNLLEKALVPSLQIRRIRTMALETYIIVNKSAPACLHDLVNAKNSKYAFRYSNILDVPQVRTTKNSKKSFMFAAGTLWNDLPNHFKTEKNSFNHFKSLIQSWNGSACRCSACR